MAGFRTNMVGPRAAIFAVLLIALLSASSLQKASAVQTITVYQATTPVTLDGVVQPGEWSDTPIINITSAGMGVAFEHNSTGLLMLFQWQNNTSSCSDKYCFGGVEFGDLNNTGPMGATATPTIMLLLSPSFSGSYDEFISKAEITPTPVEQDGYKTQSTCAMKLSGTIYTAECYRPFVLNDASPFDPFPSFVAGSAMEIGFAVGEFNEPGLHAATDMSTYVLILSNQTYTSTSTTSLTLVTSSSSVATSSTSSTTVSTTTAAPSATTYAEELAVIVVGFSALMLVVLTKYRSR